MAFKIKNSKFITLEKAGLRLTKKEFMKAKARFDEYEDRVDNKFKRMRSPEQKSILPKYENMESENMGFFGMSKPKPKQAKFQMEEEDKFGDAKFEQEDALTKEFKKGNEEEKKYK